MPILNKPGYLKGKIGTVNTESSDFKIRQTGKANACLNAELGTETIENTEQVRVAGKLCIDEASKKMIEKNIFYLKHQQLDTVLVEYLCTKMNPGCDLIKLKLKNCDLHRMAIVSLTENIQIGKVDHLDLSGNEDLDFSAVKKILEKLRCESLKVGYIQIDEDQVKILGDLNVRKLNLNYAEMPGTISVSLSRLLPKGLEKLSLVDCNLSCEQFVELALALDDINMICLSELDLSHIKLERKGLKAIGAIINRTKGSFERLALFGCRLIAESLNAFTQMVESKIRVLDLGWNEELARNGMQAVIDVARKASVIKLDLSSLSLEPYHIRQLTESSVEVQYLNLSENPKIEGDDVGMLVSSWKIQELNISECMFMKEDFEKLAKNIRSHKLQLIYCNEESRVQDKEWAEELKRTLRNAADTVFTMDLT